MQLHNGALQVLYCIVLYCIAVQSTTLIVGHVNTPVFLRYGIKIVGNVLHYYLVLTTLQIPV